MSKMELNRMEVSHILFFPEENSGPQSVDDIVENESDMPI